MAVKYASRSGTASGARRVSRHRLRRAVSPAVRPRRPIPHEGNSGSPQKSAFLYVNPGLGTSVLPLRLGMPPEITVLTLRAAR